MKKGDFAVVILIAIFAVIWLFPNYEGSCAEVYVNGELYKTIPLDKNVSLTVTSEFGTNTVVIESGQVFIMDSDCPGKQCEKGKIYKTSQSLVCLPNRLSVVIEGEKNTDETDVII